MEAWEGYLNIEIATEVKRNFFFKKTSNLPRQIKLTLGNRPDRLASVNVRPQQIQTHPSA